MIKPAEFNNISYALAQALLGRITPDIFTISFNLDNKIVEIKTIVETDKRDYLATYGDFKLELTKALEQFGFQTNFWEESISEEVFLQLDFKQLNYVAFLRYYGEFIEDYD